MKENEEEKRTRLIQYIWHDCSFVDNNVNKMIHGAIECRNRQQVYLQYKSLYRYPALRLKTIENVIFVDVLGLPN